MTPPKNNTIAMALIILAMSVRAAPDTSIQDLSSANYDERPLKLPELAAGVKCPVSVGANDVVSSEHPYIAGAGGYFFGNGPVFVGLYWKPSNEVEMLWGFWPSNMILPDPACYALQIDTERQSDIVVFEVLLTK